MARLTVVRTIRSTEAVRNARLDCVFLTTGKVVIMKRVNAHKRNLRPLLVAIAIVPIALVVFAVLGAAKNNSTINITVRNNSQRSMVRLYLAAGDPDSWGPDQLSGSTIPPGGTFELNNVTCNGASVRVIAEDPSGCFVYNNATCDGNQTWEITNAAVPDCGGQ